MRTVIAILRRAPTPPRDPSRKPRTGLLSLAATVGALALCHCAPAPAQGEEAQLEALRARIEQLTEELNAAESRRGEVMARIGDNEVRTGRLISHLRAIEQKLEANEAELEALQGRKRDNAARRLEQLSRLRLQIRVSYSLGRQDYLKLLLNQEDPARVARSLVYHRYMRAARLERINALSAQLEELAQGQRTIELKAAALRQLRAEKSQTRERLEDNRHEHRELLGRLAGEIEDGKARLDRLRGDEQKLQRLLAGLRQELEEMPALEEQAQPFARLRGTLPWPAGGRIVHRYGTPRKTDNLSWQGVLIATESGAPVSAVSHGRVAFADWLRGFGLLLIIDHGEGYMSLYGRNQSLFKEVGDWVNAGELIAVVGASGGEEQTGLYFEIRHNGRPTNPVSWCAGSPPSGPARLVSG